MKRSIPVLNKTDLRKFVRFCSEDRGTGDFEIHFGLGRTEIESLKQELGISSAADATSLLKNVFDLDDAERALREERQKIEVQKKREEADKRLAESVQARQDAISKQRKRVSAVQVQRDDQRRQKRFDKQQAKKDPIKKTGWQLPINEATGLTPEKFKHEICTLGMKFVKAKYSVERSDVINEARRLNLKIDFDLIPR